VNKIGKAYKRVDGMEKVLGKTKFINDIGYENLLYSAPVYSKVPYGKIKSIDFSKAKSHLDFIDFVSAKDIPGKNQIGVIFEDQPLFADTIVRFIGDVIGLVISTSLESARNIAKLVVIEIDEFDPIFTINSSRESNSNFLHKTNLACKHNVNRGNIEIGFVDSDIIVERIFTTPIVEHYYLEPQGCIAIPGNNTIKLLGSLQCPYYIQKAVSRVLGMPLENVEVEQSPTGGAFGGKEDIPSELCARVGVAAMKLNKPIKLIYSRHDDMQLTSKRHSFQMRYKVGVSKDGKLIAADILLEENSGAYATLSSVVSYRSAMQAMGPYSIPNINVLSNSYYTNLPPNGAFRGFGSPQITFAHERMMDILANKLDIDPIKFRLKNILNLGDETMTGQKLTSSVGARQTLEKSADKVDLHVKLKSNSRYLEGFGIGTCHYGNCLGAAGWHLDGSGVHIEIKESGLVDVAFGLVEMGQGAKTVVAQMTAEAFGLTVGQISVLPTNTNLVPDSGPSVASRNVVMTGNAILDASKKILPILKNAGSKLLNCNPIDININNGIVTNNLTGNAIEFSKVTEFLYQNEMMMKVDGWWHTPKLDYNFETGTGEAYFTYSYATQIVKVRVDKFTGIVKVLNVWAAHDVGKAINPAGLEAQIEGGVTQGIGMALTEKFVYNKGKVETLNLSTYLLPTANDIAHVETIIIEDPEPLGPWGAKGIGEPAIIPTAAAIANAVSNAIGTEINEIPITSEMVLEKLMKKEM
jgi:CO/xanthine dehydrogenase Mo-binding subunit